MSKAQTLLVTFQNVGSCSCLFVYKCFPKLNSLYGGFWFYDSWGDLECFYF